MQVTHIITGLNNGGAEAVLYRLCTNDTGATHTVISLMDMGKYGSMLEKAGITVHCLNMPQGKVTLSGLRKLYTLLKKGKPDAVQTWMYHADLIGGVIAKLAGVKKVFWNIRHSTLEAGKSKRSTIVIAKLCARLSKRVPTGIVCCADEALAVHAAIGYDKSKMTVIYNGYRLDQFNINTEAGNAVKQELDIAHVPLVLGLVGRFNPQKDHANLLNALALLKEKHKYFVCLLVGAGINPDNTELYEQLKSLGLLEHVHLLDQRSDIPAVMNALDVHVLSSTTEGFPNVVAEAMACGTPCVTTDVGDAGLIVGDTGWVVPPRNAEALADAIEQALLEKKNKPEAWQQRKQASRARIEENFSVEKMVEKYHRVWEHSDSI